MIEHSNLRKTTYRLYPTPKQASALSQLLHSHQQLYNAALEERISAWAKARKSISYAEQCKSLTLLRRDLPRKRAEVRRQLERTEGLHPDAVARFDALRAEYARAQEGIRALLLEFES